MVNDTGASGGQPQNGITTADACLQICAENGDCFGVDVDFNNGAILCWFLSQSSLQNIRAAANVYHYILESRCDGKMLTANHLTSQCILQWLVLREI